MKWIVAALIVLLAVPAMAQQNRRTLEIPAPRYAAQQGASPAASDAGAQPPLYGNPKAAPAQHGAAPQYGAAQHGAGAQHGAAATHGGQHYGQPEMAHVGTVQQKLRPPELLAEALSTSQDAFRDGQRWALADALARGGDRTQQVRITQLYWKLAGAQADYHFARDQSHRLWKATERHADKAAVLSARHTAEAAVDDAEVTVVAAQHDLAETMRLSPDERLPLAVDQPHVGEYKTQFDSLFSGRTPPARLYLTNRALPVRRKAIDVHGEAIIAAQDALDATVEEYERGTADLATLLYTFEEYGQQRVAFVAAVRDYNQDIAEYALTVAPPGANGDRLVAMLIKSPVNSHRAAPDARRAPDPRERRGSYEAQPRDRTFRDDSADADRSLAPPAEEYRGAPQGDYRAGPPADYQSAPPADNRFAPPADYRSAPPADNRYVPNGGYRSSAVEPGGRRGWNQGAVLPVSGESPAAPDAPEAAAGGSLATEAPAGYAPPDQPPAQDPFGGQRYQPQRTYQAQKPLEHEAPRVHEPPLEHEAMQDPAVNAAAHQAPVGDPALGEYSGLAHLAPALRAQKLAGILHWWQRSLPPDSGEPTSLVAVLRQAPPTARKTTIDAYWRAREAAALYQIYGEAGDQLASLSASALRSREQHGGAATMLRVQASRLALQSALMDAHANLLVAEWELAMATGAHLQKPWPLPTTVPHAGRYRLPAHREQLGSARRWADTLLPLEAAIQERAAAVVFADAARADAAHPHRVTPIEINQAVREVYRQCRAGEAFLRAQTDYNLAIADFALRTAPPAASVEQLVSRLVIPRNVRDGA